MTSLDFTVPSIMQNDPRACKASGTRCIGKAPMDVPRVYKEQALTKSRGCGREQRHSCLHGASPGDQEIRLCAWLTTTPLVRAVQTPGTWGDSNSVLPGPLGFFSQGSCPSSSWCALGTLCWGLT